MAITCIARFQAKKECYDELHKWMTDHLIDMKDHAGNLNCYASGNSESGLITIYEKWNSQEDHEAYLAWRTEVGHLEHVVSLLATDGPEITYEDVLHEHSNE